MTTQTTDDLRALLEKATPGPWRYFPSGSRLIEGSTRRRNPNSIIVAGPPTDEELVAAFHNWPPHDDAVLIVAAVNALPALLDEVERLRKALRRMVSEETDWENGAIGVGQVFRNIAREALEAGIESLSNVLEQRASHGPHNYDRTGRYTGNIFDARTGLGALHRIEIDTACSRCAGQKRVYTRHPDDASYSYKPCPKCSGGECERAYLHDAYVGEVCRFCEVQL